MSGFKKRGDLEKKIIFELCTNTIRFSSTKARLWTLKVYHNKLKHMHKYLTGSTVIVTPFLKSYHIIIMVSPYRVTWLLLSWVTSYAEVVEQPSMCLFTWTVNAYIILCDCISTQQLCYHNHIHVPHVVNNYYNNIIFSGSTTMNNVLLQSALLI